MGGGGGGENGRVAFPESVPLILQVDIQDSSERYSVFAGFSDGDANCPPDIPGIVVKKKDPRVPAFSDRIIVDTEASGLYSLVQKSDTTVKPTVGVQQYQHICDLERRSLKLIYILDR